jgi:hypothetical protein
MKSPPAAVSAVMNLSGDFRTGIGSPVDGAIQGALARAFLFLDLPGCDTIDSTHSYKH